MKQKAHRLAHFKVQSNYEKIVRLTILCPTRFNSGIKSLSQSQREAQYRMYRMATSRINSVAKTT